MRALFTVLLVCLAACAPAASSPSASPSSVTSVTPTATPTPAATATAAPTSTPSATPIALPTVAFVAAAGSGVVWTLVGNSRLFRSRDRGDSWEERTTPATPAAGIASEIPSSEIAFVSDAAGWVLRVTSTPARCFGQVVEIYRTTDGAATWQKLSASGIGTTGCAQGLAFVDANTGYFTSWDPNGTSRVFRTADSGSTWTASQPLPAPPGFSNAASADLRGGVVSDFGSATFVSVLGLGGSQQRAYVYRSADRGATWTFAGQAPNAESIATVITSTRWLQLGAAGQSRETTDGGGSWHAYTSDYQQAAPVAPQLVFGDANAGYASVRGSIQRTTDSGAHWTGVRTPGT